MAKQVHLSGRGSTMLPFSRALTTTSDCANLGVPEATCIGYKEAPPAPAFRYAFTGTGNSHFLSTPNVPNRCCSGPQSHNPARIRAKSSPARSQQARSDSLRIRACFTCLYMASMSATWNGYSPSEQNQIAHIMLQDLEKDLEQPLPKGLYREAPELQGAASAVSQNWDFQVGFLLKSFFKDPHCVDPNISSLPCLAVPF